MNAELLVPVRLGAVVGKGAGDVDALTGSKEGTNFCDAETDHAKQGYAPSPPDLPEEEDL